MFPSILMKEFTGQQFSMPKSTPASITHEQAQEIIRRLGMIIVLLAPRWKDHTDERNPVHLTDLKELTADIEDVLKTAGLTEYRR